VLFHHFDRFLIEYESRFEREYGFFRFHPHLHFLVTEGGMDAAGVFHEIPRIDDARLAEIFAREVLAMLVRKELLSPEQAERILSSRHTGFNVHSRVRAWTKPEADLKPTFVADRLQSFLVPFDDQPHRTGKGKEKGIIPVSFQ